MRLEITALFVGWLFIVTTASAQEAVVSYGPQPAAAERTLLIHGSTDISVFAPFLETFSKTDGQLRIIYEQRSTNDISQLANESCATQNESADLLISSSIDQQIKLVNDGCAQTHTSPGVEQLPTWSKWRNEVFGLTYEPAVMVYNRELMSLDEVPRSRFDLIDLLRNKTERFERRVATYDIEASGAGYLFAFADSQQATTYGRLIEAFGWSKVVTTCCASQILSDVAAGKYLLAYNMLGSYALAHARQDGRIGIVAPSDYTLILSRAALVPKFANNAEDSKRFIDFALSADGRKLLHEAALIVPFDDPTDEAAKIISGSPPNLRPMSYSPAQLVGLDRQKRRIFSRQWRSSLNPESATRN